MKEALENQTVKFKNIIDSYNSEFQYGQHINYADLLELMGTTFNFAIHYHALTSPNKQLEEAAKERTVKADDMKQEILINVFAHQYPMSWSNFSERMRLKLAQCMEDYHQWQASKQVGQSQRVVELEGEVEGLRAALGKIEHISSLSFKSMSIEINSIASKALNQ